MNIQLKRAYEPPEASDGARVLVDRLWPRGISKEAAHLDLWLREIAPSTELRRWFGHDPERWEEFRRRYRKELADQPDLVEQLRALAKKGTLTLVYGAKDEEHNDAVVLQQLLKEKGAHPVHSGHSGR